MATDLNLNVSGPVATIVDAVSRVAAALLNNDAERRKTMSESARAEQDKILAQAYWDWRGLLQRLGLVGQPSQEPPKG